MAEITRPHKFQASLAPLGNGSHCTVCYYAADSGIHVTELPMRGTDCAAWFQAQLNICEARAFRFKADLDGMKFIPLFVAAPKPNCEEPF